MRDGAERRSPGSEVRIMIVDDHPMVCEGLRDLIQRSKDLTVCGMATSRSEALAALAGLDPDLVILDLSLGETDGTRLIVEILERSSRARVLVLSTYEETVYAERCLRAGARGYLNKRAAAEEVRSAVRTVADGGVYLSEAEQARRATPAGSRRAPNDGAAGPVTLSDRELEVFEYLGRGCGPTRIAESIGLSVRTVEGYESRIMVKLGLENTEALSRFAVSWFRDPRR